MVPDDETQNQHPDHNTDADETQLRRAQRSIDEAKDAAREDNRLADTQAGMEKLPLNDPPQHTTGYSPS